jgi:DNA-binding NarL/FixJ family response regulator
VIRVLIVDDHEFVRAGLSDLLGDAEGIVVVGECADGAEVPDIAPRVQPDVVLMDVQMPRVNGPDATRTLLAHHPAVRVLMVSASTSSRVLADAAAAGASGYLLQGGDARALVDAVRVVADGGTAWPVDSLAGVSRSAEAPANGAPSKLNNPAAPWAAP